MKKILIGSFIIIFLLLIVQSCKSGNEPRYKIGFSQCSGDYWREKTNFDMRMELLNHPDVQLDIRNANNDSKRQEEDLRYFINNDYDIILLSPNESGALVGIVNEAMDKGIPVVTFDRQIDSDNFTAHLEVDNYALGKGVARYARSLGKHPLNIIEIRGPESASPAQLRHQGFVEGIKDYKDMKILADAFADWDEAKAARQTDSLLTLYPEVNMIFAHTDYMALGASGTLKNRGRSDVSVIGIDGFPYQGIKGVSDGTLTATFLYPTEGQRLLKLALAILEGNQYERMNRVSPLSPVDISNADILLAQDTLLNEGTTRIALLNEKVDQQLARYSSQKMLLWAVLIILILLSGFLFLLLRNIISGRRYQHSLEEKNEQLQEEKQKQEKLYEQLSEATKSKLMFFTNVSHDLRTPLTLISGPVEQLAEDDSLGESNKSLMKIAKKNIGILRRLIDQILDFRKLENGKTDLKLSEVNFPALVTDWADAFKDVARRRDITLSIDVEDETNFKTAVDVEKMERVFFNLMSNAFKHTPDNGKISVSCKQSETTVSYSVKDTGTGIDDKEINRIFERFYQAEGGNPKGSGIGLALTKAFVELHGGSITVASEKGKGSEFTVSFPVRHTDSKEVVVSHISKADIETELTEVEVKNDEFNKEKATLLVIDDNKDIRDLISIQLGVEFNVITATDGLQGLRMATKYVPDIIICDVMMPVMDGMECVRQLKEEITTSHIPVLMLTACSLDEQRAEGYESGADAYLPKPFNLSLLTVRCRNLLANRRRIKELYTGKGRGIVNDKRTEAENKVPTHRPNDVESEFYSKFVDLVNTHISEADLQVSDIASEMGLGQSQFTRKIKALTNYTPVELIRNIRLQKAKSLLIGSEKSVSEIAYMVGFTSLAYFSRCYKEAFGISPTDTKEGNKK